MRFVMNIQSLYLFWFLLLTTADSRAKIRPITYFKPPHPSDSPGYCSLKALILLLLIHWLLLLLFLKGVVWLVSFLASVLLRSFIL